MLNKRSRPLFVVYFFSCINTYYQRLHLLNLFKSFLFSNQIKRKENSKIKISIKQENKINDGTKKKKMKERKKK